ncbi:MAG: hypothetical protein ACREQL_01335, partial [Candidatus Binatia bacterium]
MHTRTPAGVRHPFSRPLALPMLVVALGLAASPAAAAISFVKNVGTAAIGNITGTTLTLTLGSGVSVPAGNAVIVSFTLDPKAGAITCADSKGNAYTADVDVTNGSGTNGARTVIFHSLITTALAAGNTITVSHPNTKDRAMSANEFSGFAGGILVDQTANGTGNDASPTTGPATTTTANELLIGTAGVEARAETFTPGTGYTALASIESGAGPGTRRVAVFPEYRIVAAIGTYVADGTLSAAAEWATGLATYKT